MASLVALAARNLRRNPRRTAITLGGIMVGVAAQVFMAGTAVGFIHLVTDLLAESRLGSIQVHAAGAFEEESEPLKKDLPQDPAVEARMLSVPGVKAVSPRILFEGMLSNGREGTVVYVTALDPPREKRVCTHRWDAVPTHDFVPGRPEDALVGSSLLDGLGVQKDGMLLLTASTRGGSTNALDVHVLNGLGVTDPLQSRRRVELTLAHAQDLLGMEGRVTEYALAVDHERDLDEVAAQLRQTLGPGYEVHTWMQLASDMADIIRTLGTVMIVIVLMLVLLVLSGIANTMLMAVHERTREIGTMLAMGMRKRRVMLGFVWEAGVLGLVGGVMGAVAGYALVALVNHTGFPVKPPGSEVDNYLRPVTNLAVTVVSALVCALGAMLASLYPARRAASLTPVEALRNE
jgi:putative ABC transport system permease protein